MAVSRYDLPAQAEFKSTYVPIPFDEIIQLGEKTAARRDQGMLMADELSASLQDFPVAPGADEAWFQENIHGLQSEIDETVQTLDPGSYEFRRKIFNAARKQTRDPHWRLAKQNYEPYWEARKQLQENADLPAANRRELEEYIAQYEQEGFKKFGAFRAPGVREYHDYAKYLDEKGKGFRESGIDMGYLNKDGTLKYKSGRSGVHVSRVAEAYGYDYIPDDPKTKKIDESDIQLRTIPADFLGSQAGGQMILEAQDLSRRNGYSFEENLQALYEGATRPLVNKYSGMKITEDINMTALGTARAKEQDEDRTVHIIDVLSKRLKNEIGAEGFKENGGFEKVLSIVSPIAKRRLDKSISNLTPGRPMEEALSEIENDFNPENYKDLNLAEKYAMKFLGRAVSEMVQYMYKKNAPFSPSEDYMTIAEEVMKEQGVEGRWEDLSQEKKSEIHKLTAQYRQDFWDRDVHTAIEAPAKPEEYVKLKNNMASIMFGGSADNGKVSGSTVLSGVGTIKTVIDPKNGEEVELNELISKDSSVEYIGKTSYDNPYGPGLHTIQVDGEPYFTYYTEEDKLDDVIPYLLYDWRRNPAGLGSWFQQGNYFIRGVERDKEQAIEVLTKNQYEEAVRSGQISKDGRGRTANAKVFTSGQGPRNVVDIYNEDVLAWVNSQKR